MEKLCLPCVLQLPRSKIEKNTCTCTDTCTVGSTDPVPVPKKKPESQQTLAAAG